MFDEIARLRENPALLHLLNHYVQAAAPDKAVWHDRLMALDTVAPKDLVKLYGTLLANEWLEQNTGVAAELRSDGVAQCYRVTSAGVKALKLAESTPKDDGDASEGTP